MILNLNFPCLQLNGTPFTAMDGTPTNMARTLAEKLAEKCDQFGSIKAAGFARELFAKNEITIDKEDLLKLKEFVNGLSDLRVLVKAEILLAIEKCLSA